MFSDEHNKFILEAYFRSGQRDQHGVWQYSQISCFAKFQQQFANIDVGNVIFTQHVRRIVKRFRYTGSVTKGKSSGRKPVLNEEIVEDIQQRMETSPNKSLRQLYAQTGNVYYLF